jgi:hypothetical protein
MDFLVYLGFFLAGLYTLFQIIIRVYYQFWLRPIIIAWKPYALEWKNWREVKSISRSKSVHVLFLLYGFYKNDLVQARMRQDVSREILQRHVNQMEDLVPTLGLFLCSEFRIMPRHLRSDRKKNRIFLWLLPPNFQLE